MYNIIYGYNPILSIQVIMKYIDCHAHITDSSFGDDLSEVISDCSLQRIYVIAVGMYYSGFQQIIETSQQFSNIGFGLGLHPIQLSGSGNVIYHYFNISSVPK